MLPMRALVSESFASVYRNPDLVFASIGMTVGLVAFLAIVVPILGVLAGVAAIIIGLAIVGFTFNIWARLGAYGRARVTDQKPLRIAQMAIFTGLKIVLIVLLIGVVQGAVGFVLESAGLSGTSVEMPLNENGGLDMMNVPWADILSAGVATTVLSIVISCYGYSFFSANLTSTALDLPSDSSLTHSNVTDFAVVLILLYGAAYGVQVVVAFTGQDTAAAIAAFVSSLWATFAVAYAHGARYRVAGNVGPDQSGIDT